MAHYVSTRAGVRHPERSHPGASLHCAPEATFQLRNKFGVGWQKKKKMVKSRSVELGVSPDGLPWWLSWWRIHLQCRRPQLDPWVGMIPWKREQLPTPVCWPGEFQGLCKSMGSQRVGHNWAAFTFIPSWADNSGDTGQTRKVSKKTGN